jgi:hypothetical protein
MDEGQLMRNNDGLWMDGLGDAAAKCKAICSDFNAD